MTAGDSHLFGGASSGASWCIDGILCFKPMPYEANSVATRPTIQQRSKTSKDVHCISEIAGNAEKSCQKIASRYPLTSRLKVVAAREQANAALGSRRLRNPAH
jgi:hypothetical protein